MLTSNQRGRGNDPVVVEGRITSAVAVNISTILRQAEPGVKGVRNWHTRQMTKVTVLLLLISAALAPQTAPRASQFENDEVRVWKTTLMPNVELPAHRHDHPRVIVALGSGTVRIVPQPGAPEIHRWEAG